MELFPHEALYGGAAALTYGAAKYAEWNWAKGMNRTRLAGALLRHLFLWLSRQTYDEDSGLPHLWHVMACAAMLTASEARDIGVDDRDPTAKPENIAALEEGYARMKSPTETLGDRLPEVADDDGRD